MALRQLMLRTKLSAAKKEADEHREKKNEIDAKRAALLKREADAEAAIAEITDESTAEERAAVESEVSAIEAENQTLAEEETAHTTEQERLDSVVTDIEKEIGELDERSAPPKNNNEPTPPAESRGRKEPGMNHRTKFFGMNHEERSAFFARSDVKDFVSAVRTSCQTRSVSGVTLTIPDVMLEVLRDNMEQYSKLLKYVNVRPISGTARQTITGTVPEGVWMETIGALNELDLSLNQVDVDGYKVGGFIPIPNSYLEDSDLNLGMEIMQQLGQAIGKGLDRAILFGTGSKMPLGIITRLAQTSQPDTWGANAPAWTDLHTTNIKTLNIAASTGAAFYAALIDALGIAKPNYSDGKAFWVMNRKTHINIMTKALAFDAAAALLAGVNNQMPIVGGDIIELEMLGDYEIAGGFGSVYGMYERAGAKVEPSEHVRFLQDQTVYRGYARYDGLPIFGEAFVMVSYDNSSAVTSATFPVDYANTDIGVLGVTAAAGTEVGDTVLTVTGTEVSGTTLKFKIGDYAVSTGDKVVGYTALTSGTTQITCEAGKTITVVELDANSRVIKSGKVIAVPKAAE